MDNNDIINELINELKTEHIHKRNDKLTKDEKWYDKFNSLDRYRRLRLLKLLHRGYCNTIVSAINSIDNDIKLLNIGSLKIKPSRKQYIELRKEGVEPEEAIKIVKQDFRKLNNK